MIDFWIYLGAIGVFLLVLFSLWVISLYKRLEKIEFLVGVTEEKTRIIQRGVCFPIIVGTYPARCENFYVPYDRLIIEILNYLELELEYIPRQLKEAQYTLVKFVKTHQQEKKKES